MLPNKNSISPNSTITTPHSSPANPNGKQIHITKRLEQLNKWQEGQRRLLQERQNRQRELLGLEQKSMYQMLGLRGEHTRPVGATNEQYPEMDAAPSEELERNNAEEFIDAEEYTEEILEEDDLYDESVAKLTTQDAENFLSAAYGQMAKITLKNEPHMKRPFLRKGEGLKQRFKIDPNEFRLGNLPRYKFANTHSRFALKSALKKKPKEVPQNKVNAFPLVQSHSQPLDLQEKRFQEMLLTSKNVYNSTPEISNKFEVPVVAKNARSRSPSPTTRQHNVHFNENTQNNVIIQENTSQQQEIAPGYEYTEAWTKALNSQSPNTPSNTNKFYSKAEEQSIFELLERKANEGSIDMNSPCIKQFMQRRLYEKLNGSDVEDIPVKTELINKPLLPQVQDIATDTSSELFEADSESTEEEVSASNGAANRTCDTDAATTEVRVRFTDSNETRIFKEDESIEEATHHDVVEEANDNNEFFQQFKEALFTALKIKPNTSLNDQSKLSDTTLTPKESVIINAAVENATRELQEKTELIKVRLAELEKEIQHFKDNNVLLMKARQQHELEKTLHAQEHLEAMEQVKDEKIKLEIYLHDERMKLEDEKRKFEQQIRGKAQMALAKERKEIEKLRQQCSQIENQLKSKEQSHMSAQARVRSQMRNLEREQKKLHEEIDRLTKENKRLESENLRISREQNNKLLHEINRNIAKLAPKQCLDEDHASGRQQRKSISKTIMETSAANRMHRPLHKTHITSPRKPAKSTRGGSQKLGNLEKPKRLVAGFEIETETTLESSVSDESKDTSLLSNHQGQNQQQGHHHHQQHQHQQRKNYYLSQQNEQNLEYCGDQTDDVEDDENDILEELDLVPKRQNNLNVRSRSASPTHKDGKLFSSQTSSIRNEGDNVTAQNTPPPVSASSELKREILNGDGSRDIWYSNGNLKKISADGMIIRMLYYNKDIKETNINEGTVKYYYAETNIWHTTYLDGLEILEFPNGQIEHRHKNGLVEIHYPNQSVKIINPRDNQKLEEWRFADGTQLIQMRNGDRILMLANGQKEIHTKLNKRREYPDGTVKIVYPDGSQETRYSNGRIRLKDKDGKLMMDTEITATLAK